MLNPELRTLLSRHHPVPAGELDNLDREARNAVDEDLLKLCTAYVQAVLNDEIWRPTRELSEKEQAYLAFTEQFVSSVSTLSADQVERLRAFSPADDIYNFVCALYVADMTNRLSVVMPRVLS